MTLAGFASPDPWQLDLLASRAARILLNCSRQAGKSTVTAALALRTALLEPGALVLLLSPSLRQSSEIFRKVMATYTAMGRPVPAVQESALQVTLGNRSRLVSLPGSEETVRGFTASLVVIDEAARVPDDLYRAVRPMLAVSRGRLVCLSSPFGRRGFFYDSWTDPAGDWLKIMVPADMIPGRIDPAFLAAEERALGPIWFRQEYRCSFEACVNAYFDAGAVERAFTTDIRGLFEE